MKLTWLVHLHSRIGQPSSHSNASATGANSAMFSLLRQNMELTAFHSLLHERDLVVHLHSRIGQPSSHSNASTAGANNSEVIQRHVPAIAAEHGTNSST
jgi:hypothetical protein